MRSAFLNRWLILVLILAATGFAIFRYGSTFLQGSILSPRYNYFTPQESAAGVTVARGKFTVMSCAGRGQFPILTSALAAESASLKFWVYQYPKRKGDTGISFYSEAKLQADPPLRSQSTLTAFDRGSRHYVFSADRDLTFRCGQGLDLSQPSACGLPVPRISPDFPYPMSAHGGITPFPSRNNDILLPGSGGLRRDKQLMDMILYDQTPDAALCDPASAEVLYAVNSNTSASEIIVNTNKCTSMIISDSSWLIRTVGTSTIAEVIVVPTHGYNVPISGGLVRGVAAERVKGFNGTTQWRCRTAGEGCTHTAMPPDIILDARTVLANPDVPFTTTGSAGTYTDEFVNEYRMRGFILGPQHAALVPEYWPFQNLQGWIHSALFTMQNTSYEVTGGMIHYDDEATPGHGRPCRPSTGCGKPPPTDMEGWIIRRDSAGETFRKLPAGMQYLTNVALSSDGMSFYATMTGLNQNTRIVNIDAQSLNIVRQSVDLPMVTTQNRLSLYGPLVVADDGQTYYIVDVTTCPYGNCTRFLELRTFNHSDLVEGPIKTFKNAAIFSGSDEMNFLIVRGAAVDRARSILYLLIHADVQTRLIAIDITSGLTVQQRVIDRTDWLYSLEIHAFNEQLQRLVLTTYDGGALILDTSTPQLTEITRVLPMQGAARFEYFPSVGRISSLRNPSNYLIVDIATGRQWNSGTACTTAP